MSTNVQSMPDPPPISREEVLERQARARFAAAAAGYDALLAIGRSFYDRPGDLAYLANHLPPFPTAVFSETNRGMGHGFFLLPIDGGTTLITDPRRHRADLVVADETRAAADLGAAVVDLLRERGLDRARIGMVGDDILPAPFARLFAEQLPATTFVPEAGIVAELRQIKSPAEQVLMRRAAVCSDAALTAAISAIQRGGITEREVCADAFAAGLRAGADFLRYVRVHSGPWSASMSRWPQAMDRQILPGEVVALDAIGAYQGYQFDVNRTTVQGTPDADHRALLETTLEATLAAVDACRAGNRITDVADAAHAVIARSRFADAAGHMAGHGIGLETVELPYIQRGNTTELRPGMCLCVEPGLAVAGWAGALIEFEVIIQESGPAEVITPTPARLW